MNDGTDWSLWQFLDSAFPTGGFAHSGGLEAAWQHGEVTGRISLEAWIESSLLQSARGGLPFVMAAHQEPGRLGELDELCEVFTLNHVANRASRLQGRALWSAVERTFTTVAGAVLPGPVFAHYAPVFGAVCPGLGFAPMLAARAFVFVQLRAFVAAAVRLNIIGSMAAQTLQAGFATRCDAAARLGASLTLDDLSQTAPLIDLWQGAQDRLYSRLYQS